LWERVEHLLDYLDEMFTLHPSPNEMARSLRVAVVVFVVIIVIFFAVAFVFLFVFFLVWLLSKDKICNYRLISRSTVRSHRELRCTLRRMMAGPQSLNEHSIDHGTAN